MKTVIIEGAKKVTLVDTNLPVAFGHFAVVRIHAAPMCTEYRKYLDGTVCSQLGHEAAGEVVDVIRSMRVKKGDRVVVMPQYPCGECSLCEAGDYIHCEQLVNPLSIAGTEYGTATYAEYILKPDFLLIPIPDDISYEEGSMACCAFGPTFAAAKNMNTGPSDTVMITGLGPVGLGGVIDSTHRGAKVIGVSCNSYRRSLALDLGAFAVIDPSNDDVLKQIMKLTNGRGVDLVMECSGKEMYQRLAFDGVKRKGQIAFIGEAERLSINISRDLLRKGLTVHGIWHWNLKNTDEMLNLIRDSRDKIKKLITHVFPMEKVEDAFMLQATGECGKVILKPGQLS